MLENNLKPEECVYFDDSEENIKMAKSLGIKAFLFEGIDSVRDQVNVMLT
jgi:FMN phosphatase YigB (HAD superfamily)